MKKIISLSISTTLAASLLSFSALADTDPATATCPSTDVISQVTFDAADGSTFGYDVSASQPVIDSKTGISYSVSLSKNITSKTAEEAIDSAQALVDTMYGPTNENPDWHFSLKEGFVKNACEYKTPYGITVVAVGH